MLVSNTRVKKVDIVFLGKCCLIVFGHVWTIIVIQHACLSLHMRVHDNLFSCFSISGLDKMRNCKATALDVLLFFWCLSTCTFLTYIFSWVWTNATRQMHKNGNIDVLGDPENCKITIPTLPRKCHITKFTASPRLQDLTGRDIFYTWCTLPGTNWRLLCKLRHFNRGHGRGAQIVFQIDFDTTAFKN